MKISIRRSFAFKLSLYMITCVVIIFVGILIYNYHVSKKLVLESTFENVKNLINFTSLRITDTLNIVKRITEDIADCIEFSTQTENEISSMLQTIIQTHPIIHGGVIAFEPYKFNKDKYYFCSAFCKTKYGIKYVDIGTPEYDYFKWDWYAEPKKSGHGLWSEPYFGTGGGVFMVTYSEPIFKNIDGEREFCGVVECDIALDSLVDMVYGTDDHRYDTDYAFLISSKGNIIAHPGKDFKSGKNILKSIENVDPDAKSIIENMIAGKTGFVKYFSSKKNKMLYIYYQPLEIENTKWFLGIVIPEDELFRDLNAVTFKIFVIGLIGYILTLILIAVLANKMTKPLRTLASASHRIGEGDFQVKLPKISSTDEIGTLSHSFHIMQENLIKYITNLQETTAAKEKIEKELSIAREIQQNLLPQKFPRLKQIDLYATLIPAREVGGDLYDFFFIDEKHLCFAIGDVSGKGVPAALFMAVVKTLLRAKVSFIRDPAEIFNAMNNDLCKENKSYMFVTFFLGILDIETGVLEYCNAGHNPPLIHTANKGFYYFHTKNAGPPLGIIADIKYTGNRLELLPEDIFFLYTDGVTEAMNIDDIQFSEEKLIDVLDKNKNKDETVSNIVNDVKLAVDQHVAGAIQSDDITMLIFKFNG